MQVQRQQLTGLPHHPRRHRPLILNNRRLERIHQLATELRREIHQPCFGDQVALTSVGQDEAPGSKGAYARFDADRRGEAAEEDPVAVEEAPALPQHRLEVFVVAREVHDGAADHEVDTAVRKRHLFYRLNPDIGRGQIRRERLRQCSDGVDCCATGIDGANVEALAQEIDEIPPGTAAGIADARAGRHASAQELVEQVDVDFAELRLKVSHGQASVPPRVTPGPRPCAW